MAKKVSKFFRIGVEGDTCDGRVISAQDITWWKTTPPVVWWKKLRSVTSPHRLK